MQKRLFLGLACVTVAITGCSLDRLTEPNPNTATQEAAAAAQGALQLQVTGVFRQFRNGRGPFITATARFGREGYIYTPNEGRNTSHYLTGLPGENRLDPSGFAVGVWAGPYGNLRDIYVTQNAVASNTVLTAAQKSAAAGALRTIEALELLYVISTRDAIGAVVQINADPQQLAPFVSRDSTYRYILATLDAAYAELQAGGTAFPFTLHAGYAGFNTPANFALFNRAITARAAAYYATSGGGAAAWTRAATAIGQSFLNRSATTAAQMNVGVYNVHSLATGDAGNGIDRTSNADFLVHPSYTPDAVGTLPSASTGAQRKADGNPDNRYTSKIVVLAVPRNAPQGLGIATNLAMNVYPNQSTPVPIIRNEELILLDAEIRLANGDIAGAIDNINQVRTNIGGLPPTTVTVASPVGDVLTAILYEKRFSLLAEGHRWIDMRRYGRLASLPIDVTTGSNAHFIARVMPVPQAECLSRAGSSAPAPGC
jgi:starch-binding outer membrane protein, SusD/RagB family